MKWGGRGEKWGSHHADGRTSGDNKQPTPQWSIPRGQISRAESAASSDDRGTARRRQVCKLPRAHSLADDFHALRQRRQRQRRIKRRHCPAQQRKQQLRADVTFTRRRQRAVVHVPINLMSRSRLIGAHRRRRAMLVVRMRACHASRMLQLVRPRVHGRQPCKHRECKHARPHRHHAGDRRRRPLRCAHRRPQHRRHARHKAKRVTSRPGWSSMRAHSQCHYSRNLPAWLSKNEN
jgi:hypothetical protein